MRISRCIEGVVGELGAKYHQKCDYMLNNAHYIQLVESFFFKEVSIQILL